MEAFLPVLRPLAFPIPLLLGIALLSVWLEQKLPFGGDLKSRNERARWGEGLFRFLWSLLFFDFIPVWLYLQFQPALFPSPLIVALAAAAVIFVLGYLPLAILLGSRFNFDWGYLFFTLLWIFTALSASLWTIQKGCPI